MLLVKTKIGPSAIHGIGLFADQLIPKGTITWRYEPSVDMGLTEQQVNSLSPISKEYYVYYSYYDEQRALYILPTDNLKFINHSNQVGVLNIDSTPDQDIAHRDIQPGQEMLCDYTKFDPTYFERLHITSDQLKAHKKATLSRG